MEGGFKVDEKQYDIQERNCIVVLPEWKEISLNDPDLPVEVCIHNINNLSLLFIKVEKAIIFFNVKFSLVSQLPQNIFLQNE